MANNLLTITQITREALRVLHQQLNFVGNVNRQYDSQFAKTGAKIGTSLNIRMPAKYTVRTGATYSGQDHVERSTPLTVSSQYGVDVSFTTVERTMSLDMVSDRILKPAMAQLAAKIEADAFATAYQSVANVVNGTTDTLMTYRYFQQCGSILTDNLAPRTSRTASISPASSLEFLDATKALFNNSNNLDQQFREGLLLRTGGFDVYENTLLPVHTNGTLAGTPLTTGAALGTSTTANVWASTTDINIDGATTTTTIKIGDVITLSGVYDVHPETKQNTGKLKRFVSQETLTAGAAATLTVKPALIYGSGNAFQNCVLSGVSNTDGLTVTRLGAAGAAFGQDMFFHEDAFCFATADLIDVSQFGAECSRQVMDGISMRWTQQYAIGSDTVAGRFDVLWGFAPLYPELAVRHMYEQDLL